MPCGGIGTSELLIIFIILLILFGAKRLPALARSIGTGINEFKKGLNTKMPDIDLDMDQDPKNQAEKKTEKKTKGKSTSKTKRSPKR